MNRYSYYEVCAMTPPVQIANPMANARAILDLCQELPETTRLVVTPELSLTGYTCQDLFYESLLQHQTLQALEYLTRNLPDCLSVLVGLPLQVGNHLYNTAAFITHNEVKGFYAKTYLPNYNEYYEQRWFASSLYLPEHSQVHFMNKAVPVTDKILFEDYTTGAVIGAEI